MTPLDPASDPLGAWLAQVRERQGSDLLLVAGRPPMVRARGALHPAASEVLTADDIARATGPLVPARLRAQFEAGDAIDLAFSKGPLGRFRMNLHLERGRVAAAIRALPTHVPTLGGLGFSHDIT